MGNSSSGHVCHSPQHASSPVYGSDSGASSTGDRCSVTRLAGEVDVHVSTVSPCSSKSEIKDHQEGQVILIAPWWPFQPWFPHLLRLCVGHTRIILYRQDLLSQQGYVSDGKSYCLRAWRLSCSTTKQQDFRKRSLDSRQPLEDPQQTERTTTGGFALLTGQQDKELIRLVPQLLK